MIYEKISIANEYNGATLTLYVHGNIVDSTIQSREAIVLCPGGGYNVISDRENEPCAKRFFAQGFNVFVLEYSVKEKARDFAPLIQVASAIKYVRENAILHKTNPDKIFVMGFSAGGHLAASSGILYDHPKVKEALNINSENEGINRPNGLILCYPVITGGEFRHKGSFENLCGVINPTDEQRDVFSLEKHVNKTSVPAFIWHTVTDNVVPVQNALLLINAYVENKRPIESHIFPEGPHGLSLCNNETTKQGSIVRSDVAIWVDLAINYIKNFKYI